MTTRIPPINLGTATVPLDSPRRLWLRHLTAAAVILVFVALAAKGWFAGGEGGAPPMPLAEQNLATAVGLVMQALVQAILLTCPGLVLISWLTGGKAPTWPAPLILGVACLLSCVIVTMLTLFSVRLFGPQPARYLIAGGCLAAGVASRSMLKQLMHRCRAAASWIGLMVAGGGFLLYLLLAALMAATPYPSVVPDAVDIPTFVRVAANFAQTGHLAEDYLLYCASSGKLDYASSLAIIPTTLTASCYILLWVNPHSFFLIHLLFGMVMLGVAASVAAHGLGRTATLGVVLFALFIATPFLFKPVALGSAGLMLALAGMVMVGLWQQRQNSALRRTCLLVVSASLIVMRPEGSILAAVFAVAAIMAWLSAKHSTILGALAGGGIVSVILVAFCLAIDHSSTIARNPVPRFAEYNARSGQFRKTFSVWDFYQDQAHVRLTGQPAKVLPNTVLGREILAHPFAFTRFLVERTWPAIANIAIWVDDRAPVTWAAIVILLALLAAARADQLMWVLVAAAFLAGMGLVQDHPCVRHWLCALVIVLALATRTVVVSVVPRAISVFSSAAFARGRWVARLGVALQVALLASWAGATLHLAQRSYWLRLSPVNRDYIEPLRQFAAIVPPGATTACNYPPLATCLTGRYCIGGMWFAENLDDVAARYHPDWILIDDHKKERSFSDYTRRERPLDGYRVVVSDEANRFLILRRNDEPVASVAADDAAP